jgi:hypothetical protein
MPCRVAGYALQCKIGFDGAESSTCWRECAGLAAQAVKAAPMRGQANCCSGGRASCLWRRASRAQPCAADRTARTSQRLRFGRHRRANDASTHATIAAPTMHTRTPPSPRQRCTHAHRHRRANDAHTHSAIATVLSSSACRAPARPVAADRTSSEIAPALQSTQLGGARSRAQRCRRYQHVVRKCFTSGQRTHQGVSLRIRQHPAQGTVLQFYLNSIINQYQQSRKYLGWNFQVIQDNPYTVT